MRTNSFVELDDPIVGNISWLRDKIIWRLDLGGHFHWAGFLIPDGVKLEGESRGTFVVLRLHGKRWHVTGMRVPPPLQF